MLHAHNRSPAELADHGGAYSSVEPLLLLYDLAHGIHCLAGAAADTPFGLIGRALAFEVPASYRLARQFPDQAAFDPLPIHGPSSV